MQSVRHNQSGDGARFKRKGVKRIKKEVDRIRNRDPVDWFI